MDRASYYLNEFGGYALGDAEGNRSAEEWELERLNSLSPHWLHPGAWWVCDCSGCRYERGGPEAKLFRDAMHISGRLPPVLFDGNEVDRLYSARLLMQDEGVYKRQAKAIRLRFLELLTR